MTSKIRLAEVVSTYQLSPHLRRVVFSGDDLLGFPLDRAGAHLKVLLPHPGEHMPVLAINGTGDGSNKPIKRSYTVQNYDEKLNQLTLDFVVNRHSGPATNWAAQAQAGDLVGIAGPAPRKLDNMAASSYLLLGDLTSINAVKGFAKAINAEAKIYAIMLVPTADDIIVETGESLAIDWLVTDDSDVLTARVRALAAHLHADTHVFMGLEARHIRSLRGLLHEEFGLPRQHIYAVGYWKAGLDADRFGADKQQNPL